MKQKLRENSNLSLFSVGLLFSICCLNAATSADAFKGPRQVLPSFRRTVAQLRKVTRVPIALPASVPDKFRCFVDTLTQNEYEVDLVLSGSTHDDGASSLGAIGGRKITGKKSPLYGTRNHEFGSDEKTEAKPVILAHGIRGYFVNQDRGASLVFWRQGGYSYVVAYKAFETQVVGVANSAILNER